MKYTLSDLKKIDLILSLIDNKNKNKKHSVCFARELIHELTENLSGEPKNLFSDLFCSEFFTEKENIFCSIEGGCYFRSTFEILEFLELDKSPTNEEKALELYAQNAFNSWELIKQIYALLKGSSCISVGK